MSILDRIMDQKKVEISAKKKAISLNDLEQFGGFHRPTFSAKSALASGGVIAEHKRRSPSKSDINTQSKIQEQVQLYDRGGAAVLSILTDTTFFGGSLEDLLIARAHTERPLLRKDFIYDPYQVFEAKAYGADLILLIAAVLSEAQVSELSALAHELGLEVLLEVHDKEELQKNNPSTVDLLGVNHRNLKTFEIDLSLGEALLPLMSEKQIAVAESGLSELAQIKRLYTLGFKGFLIGEHLMKEANAATTLQAINQLFR